MDRKCAIYLMSTPDYVDLNTTMIYSFLKNNDWYNGDIVVLGKDLSDSDKNEFYKVYDKVRFVDYDYSYYQKIVDITSGYTLQVLIYVFYKLAAFKDCQEHDYESCVYLDADMIILKNIIELFDNDYNFAWCEDILCDVYKKPNQYFNAGIFKFNGNYIRKIKFWDQIVSYIYNYNPATSHKNEFTNAQKLLYVDQNILNDLVADFDNVKILDKQIYNRTGCICKNEELQSVKIIHYNGIPKMEAVAKPWKTNNISFDRTSNFIWFYFNYKKNELCNAKKNEEVEPLMEKPEGKELKLYAKSLFYGKNLEDYITNSAFDEWCRFVFPEGVKEKIEPNKLYKVWYEYSDSSDPMNLSCKYKIIYIEEAPDEIRNGYANWKLNEEKIKNYLFN